MELNERRYDIQKTMINFIKICCKGKEKPENFGKENFWLFKMFHAFRA